MLESFRKPEFPLKVSGRKFEEKKTGLPAKAFRLFSWEISFRLKYQGAIAAPTGMSPFVPHGNEKNELFELLRTK